MAFASIQRRLEPNAYPGEYRRMTAAFAYTAVQPRCFTEQALVLNANIGCKLPVNLVSQPDTDGCGVQPATNELDWFGLVAANGFAPPLEICPPVDDGFVFTFKRRHHSTTA